MYRSYHTQQTIHPTLVKTRIQDLPGVLVYCYDNYNHPMKRKHDHTFKTYDHVSS